MPTPSGELTIKTLAMPSDTNANGDIFGGWLVSQMDLAGSISAKQLSKSRVVTVAIDSMIFHHPVKVGDVVSCYSQLIQIGRTSMKIQIEAWVVEHTTGKQLQVTEGLFTFVAIDDAGKPKPVVSITP